jgi:two-component system, NtrC family, sensor histidine kinase HydH
MVGLGLFRQAATMTSPERRSLSWMDLLSLVFLAGLAVLPPIAEIHKQLILLAIGILQLVEARIIAWQPGRGRSYVVLLKLVLATLLLSHTGDLGINSSYYPILFLPVVTAAVYFGPWGTLFWTALVSAAYCSYLFPVLQDYVFTDSGIGELVIRNLFFFLAAIIVNRFAVENRRQTSRYQRLAERLADTNRLLERAQAQARRSERLAALGQLSAGLAHEIRNPLGIIKGSAEILNQRLADAEPLAAELAGYISGEVNRLSDLVARFLDFARPLRLDLQPVSLSAVADRALHSVAANWKGPAIAVVRRYQENLPDVPVDERFCEQVFVNLVQNAYEAMSDAGGELQISLHQAEHGGRPGIEAAVADSGPGISAELREQIFNPFFTTKKSGVGLGLSIVSKIIDEHHGFIELASTPTGARFVLFFPSTEQGAVPAPSPADTATCVIPSEARNPSESLRGR